MINYYDILEVDRDASEEDIKRAYRKQVLRWHPDRNPFNEQAAERFLLIQKAYEHLSDYIRRSEYNDRLDGKYQEPEPIYPQPYTPPAEVVEAKKEKFAVWAIPFFTVVVAGIGIVLYWAANKQGDAVYIQPSTNAPAATSSYVAPVSPVTETRSSFRAADAASNSVDSMFRESLKQQEVPIQQKRDTMRPVVKPVRPKPEPILEVGYDD